MATAADYQGKALLNLKTPHAAQAEFLATDKKRITLNWGRRTGKSMGAGIKASMEAIMHQGTYYIIAPTIGNAQKIYWDEVLKTIFKDSPLVDQDFVKNVMGRKDYKEVGFNKNENSVTIDYIENAKVQMPDGSWKTINHDTTKPRSKIVLYGATEPDNILGIGLRGVILDECAKMDNFNYVWRKVVRPMLGDQKGWAVFISTPLGIFNPWYEWVRITKADPDKYFYSHATGYDNPYFPDDEIEEARADAIAANELHVFEQEWLAEFVNPAGAIFPEFDPDLHTFNIKELPRTGTDILGVDFGFNPDPAAILTVRIDEQGDWWLFDEVYGTDMDDDRIANVIKNKMLDAKFERIIGDANAKSSIELLRRIYRIPMVPGPKGKDSIKTGINQIHSMLRKRPNGTPRLRIASHLSNTIRELQSYSRKRDAAGTYYNVPEDANNHTIDCIRYMLKLMEAPDQDKKREPVKKERKYSKVTGRPL